MAKRELKIILREGDHRVIDDGETYEIEKLNGTDRFGVERWFQGPAIKIWPERHASEDIMVPSAMFRALMKTVKLTGSIDEHEKRLSALLVQLKELEAKATEEASAMSRKSSAPRDEP